MYSKRFQNATHLIPSTTVLIFSQSFFRSDHRLTGGDLLSMLTKQDPTPSQNGELFCEQNASASPYTQRTYLISHHPTSFSSDISNLVCMESLFHHVENYLQQFMKFPGPSLGQPWRTCFGTGWRDSNGFLRTMVTTIHKLNTGWFAFLGFLSEGEVLHRGRTTYILVDSMRKVIW
jgi:hypothetical protein